MLHRRLLLLLVFAGLALVAVAGLSPARPDPLLHVATWNMEWLVSPRSAHMARLACRDGRRATLPCDVLQDLDRDSADIAQLAAYARQLDADVIAFQEVEDAATAQRVFRGYTICMASGPGVQQAGFALRARLPHRCGPQVEALAAGERGRSGMSVTLLPPGEAPIELLVVHLKSGCAREPLDAAREACTLLARQVTALGEWITAREADARFMVLGDFNRPSPRSAGDPFWHALHDTRWHAVTHALPFRNCTPGQPFVEFIDHILVSSALVPQLDAARTQRMTYRATDAVNYRLSDHCPVRVSLKFARALY
jgi:endonuclease/exonuclease/phosphatase family metal-dependent hydrolase